GLVAHPEISTLGWIDAQRSVQVLAELEVEVVEAVASALDEHKDVESIERVVRRTTGRFVGNRTRRRPPISATVILVN
ncbi:MAG: RNase J family beta-CASP ribonuclease, partial [Actinomycetota bacterium]|nr:RNase J family beta-CASP ribonuclease [Actinomycetota bacterium]